MNRYFRQRWIGLAAGLASSLALIATQDNTLVAIALAAIIGMVFELVSRHTRYAYLDQHDGGRRLWHSALGFDQHHPLSDCRWTYAAVDRGGHARTFS